MNTIYVCCRFDKSKKFIYFNKQKSIEIQRTLILPCQNSTLIKLNIQKQKTELLNLTFQFDSETAHIID
jgi:hypothetical protein